MSHELEVFVSDQRVGVLREEIATGLMDFEYDQGVPENLAVSLLMLPDASPEDYLGYNGLPPPFEVSLPEGMLLEAIQSRFGKHIDTSSDFALLTLVGQHTIGRVTFGGPLQRRENLDRHILEAARTPGAARRLADILRLNPNLFGISGVMPKMSLYHQDGRRPGTITGLGAIVKFDSPEYVGASLVEYACLQACAAFGLAVPNVTLSPDLTSIVIDRFDMAEDGHRFGFEDACSLSGIRRFGKYNGSIEHVFDMIRHFVHPDDQDADLRALLKLVIMNDVLRNGDAHLKNFGLVYDNITRARLAPVYDVLTTQVWIREDTPAMATRKTDNDATLWLDQSGFAALADIVKLPEHQLVSLHADAIEIAMASLTHTLEACAPCPPRDALARAVEIIGSAAR